MLKNTEYLCPECGEDIDLETMDTDFDDGALSCKMCCEKCGATWREYYVLHYTGYAYKGVNYDEKGVKI